MIARMEDRAPGGALPHGADAILRPMGPDELKSKCLEMPGAEETFPFGPEPSVFKIAGKIFAISQLDSDPLKVSLKSEPELADQLRESHDSIVPGYHLNKRHWITVTIGGDAEDSLVEQLVEDSYDLVKPKRPR